jgi:hypothetical protein
MLQLNADDRPLICGVGLGGYWAERIGFLCDIRQVVFNPNLFPHENMEGKIDRPEEYADIATKCVTNFREKTAIAAWWCFPARTKRWTASVPPTFCTITMKLSGMKSRPTSSKISRRICSGKAFKTLG